MRAKRIMFQLTIKNKNVIALNENVKQFKTGTQKQYIITVLISDVARVRGQVGYAPRGAGLGGTSAHFLQSIKNAF